MLGSPIGAVILLSGVYDLEPLIYTTINEKLGLTRQEAQHLSPLHSTPTRICPAIIEWGENETAEFKRQSFEFARWWRSGDNDVKAGEVLNRNHIDLPFDLGDPLSPLGRSALFLPDIMAPRRSTRGQHQKA